MRQLLIASILFFLSTIYVLLLANLAISPYALQKAVVFLVVFFFIIAYFSAMYNFKKILTTNGKWLLLFVCTIIVQILILATGELKSPFLILIHLFMVGLSFVFTFAISLLFLLSSFTVLLIHLTYDDMLITLLATEPTFIILQLSSLLAIIPVSYIVSQHYHFKDTVIKKLHTQALTAQSILENLTELIIITDLDFKILSVNDAVVKILHKSKSELLNTPIFETLLLKNKDGKLATKEYFSFDKTHPSGITEEFLLLKTAIPQQRVTLHAQTIKDPQGKITQISFVLSNNPSNVQSSEINLDKTRALYEAMAEDMKKKLLNQNASDMYTKIIMLQKFEKDIYEAQTVTNASFNKNIARIDIAQLAKQIVMNLDFARAFHVSTDFAIKNFGKEDIKPLVTNNFDLDPEQFTGPFFTAECDAKHLEVAIEELLALAVLLASNQEKPSVRLTINRDDKQNIIIKIEASSPTIAPEDLPNLFRPHYDNIAYITNLHSGSGLEGYLAKTILDNLGIKLEIMQDEKTSTLSFKLSVPKKQNT